MFFELSQLFSSCLLNATVQFSSAVNRNTETATTPIMATTTAPSTVARPESSPTNVVIIDDFEESPSSQVRMESRSSHAPSAPTRKHRRLDSDSYAQQLCDIEQKKLAALQEKTELLRTRGNESSQVDNNDDLMFFKSLLPVLSKLDALEKLEYRIKVSQLTKTFVEGALASRENIYEIIESGEN